MATACKGVRSALALGEPLDDEQAAHLGACPGCAARLAGFARLDALLAAEPCPPAPLELTAQVMTRVQVRRARERARAVRQLAGLLGAAAVIVAAGLGLVELAGPLLPPTGIEVAAPVESFVASPASAWAGLSATVAGALEALAAAAAAAGSGPLPALPVFVPLLLAPLLLLANRALARAPDPALLGRLP